MWHIKSILKWHNLISYLGYCLVMLLCSYPNISVLQTMTNAPPPVTTVTVQLFAVTLVVLLCVNVLLGIQEMVSLDVQVCVKLSTP